MISRKYDLSSKGKLALLLETIVPRWHNRPDSEHEQAFIRFLVGLVASSYLIAVYAFHQGLADVASTIVVIGLFFVATGGIIVWLIVYPGTSVTRRLLGAVLDIGGASLALYLNGNLAAPLFIVYLWVIFGNGFRFGRKYLFFSMALSLVGYCLAIFLSERWIQSSYVTLGLLIGLVVLPLYVATLLGRLTKALNESEAANEAKATFLAVMSHEIRTPLSGIIGLISLFKQTRLDEQQQHYIRLVENSSNWLSRVITDGLDYSKIEANELVIEYLPFNLHRVLEEISAVYRQMALPRDLDFSCTLSVDVPVNLVGDQFKIIQVCNNLLSNAFKFTEKGEIFLKVDVKERQDAQVEIIFKVIDTGIGIAGEELHSIFEPFKQVDSSSSRKYGGTGLGLAISAKIVALLGGVLEVESVVDEGTVLSFCLTFPVVEGQKESAETNMDLDLAIEWVRSPAILLVEDNDVNREVISHLLDAIGVTVTVAENGDRAVGLAKSGPFDLILMDCQMPVVDGYEATRRIRREHGVRELLPIIALTAHVTVADRQRCFAAGMDAYLGKPCSLSDLRTVLMQWLPGLLNETKNIAFIREPVKEKQTGITTPVGEDIKRSNREQLHALRNDFSKIMGNAELALLSLNSPDKLEGHLKTILSETINAAERSTLIE